LANYGECVEDLPFYLLTVFGEAGEISDGCEEFWERK
jgi:hypothetical protein